MSKRVISSRLCIGYLRVGDHIVHTAPRTRCTAKDSGQLLCRYGVDATPSRQGAQKSQQATPPLQYVEDRVCLPDGNDVTKTNSRVLVDESKQADIENLGDCLRALGDGQSLGDFSLTIGAVRPFKTRTGAARGGVHWPLHQRRWESFFRNLQPAQRLPVVHRIRFIQVTKWAERTAARLPGGNFKRQ